MDDIRIVPTSEHRAESFRAAVDSVARERKYIGLIEAPPIESTHEFLRRILSGGGVQLLAVDPSEIVVGWCDILRNSFEGFRHVGRLGMGLLPEYRGRGLGKLLTTRTIQAARDAGMERIELEVFASNSRAIALYRSLGFVTEGAKRGARKLDGQYDDLIVMALPPAIPRTAHHGPAGTTEIRRASTDADIAACFEVMAELRPHLQRSIFVNAIREMERDGYHLAFLTVAGRVVAVAGYRLKRTLFCGRFLYVDDLVTAFAERSHGYGAALLAWLVEQARQLNCEELDLDSGMQRVDAHRFYKANGMEAAGYHFSVRVS